MILGKGRTDGWIWDSAYGDRGSLLGGGSVVGGSGDDGGGVCWGEVKVEVLGGWVLVDGWVCELVGGQAVGLWVGLCGVCGGWGGTADSGQPQTAFEQLPESSNIER